MKGRRATKWIVIEFKTCCATLPISLPSMATPRRMNASCKTTVSEWFCTSALVTGASNLVAMRLLFLDLRRRAATPSGKALVTREFGRYFVVLLSLYWSLLLQPRPYNLDLSVA
ncbi:unnamed protein product [Angiostrongylus costaricensis]|uniref:G_PROTEIN_RECEP_F1_2 domain-containing protein n=1 Tax=Angiostrongylus costaricensis TaxID=334426 RepID=A0A0R3PS99_ANGCS|nr:unnamed protein product [Angiostrongylus costaricensis]